MARNNRGSRPNSKGPKRPTRTKSTLFYQTLLGTWPLEELNAEGHEAYLQRLIAYMHKATKEAKLNTSWINPDEDYATAIERFVRGVLDREKNAAFLQSSAAWFREPSGRACATPCLKCY